MQGLEVDQAWAIVAGRDGTWDGQLFYAVRTTGIYCRPSCPSRRPQRKNVLFFESAEDAVLAGFRACLRCAPESATGTTTERRLRRALEYIDQHLDRRITLDELATQVGLSRYHLHRSFKDYLGLTPRQYQEGRRLAVLKASLREGAAVSRAVWAAGFGSVRGAYETAATGMGMSPGRYREGGVGVAIQYADADTRFGTVLVAWTDRGVCAVLLGDGVDQLLGELAREFPAAVRAHSSEAAAWLKPLLRYLEGTDPGLVVPLELHGTSFQMRVWQALREIPLGEVRSYGEVADAIGAPSAARAVARTCATNRVALAIPCHRVVRSGGSLSGYRWGVERKRALIEHERTLVDGRGNED